jgi:hypothetical protein
MSLDDTQKLAQDRLVMHARGTLLAPDLQAALERAWAEAAASDEGKSDIAAALGVTPDDIRPGPPPIAVDTPTSGLVPADMVMAIHWAALNVVVPVLIGLAKDEVKARMLELWRNVLLPRIRHGNRAALNDERPMK